MAQNVRRDMPPPPPPTGCYSIGREKATIGKKSPTTQKPYLDADYYVQLVNFESDDFTSATAKTIQEAQKLVETGF